MYSVQAINLIKKYEGCRLAAYDDGTGTWTIGWGHTAGVKQGDTCTQAQADKWLAEDIVIYNNAVRAYNDRYHWTQNQEDALTSFAYNLGTGSISQVTANGSRDKATIAEKMLLYVNAGGQVMPGLVTRRQEEVALFRTASDTDVTVPDSGGSTTPDTSPYYPKYDPWAMQIDKVLVSIGAASYTGSWQNRKPLAAANGLPNYSGGSIDNRHLYLLACAGQLKKP